MANDPFYDGPLGMPLSENTRRFTVIRPAASGKTQHVDQAALEALRAYITSDLEVTADLRAKMLPPVRHVTTIERVVNAICAAWGRRAG